MSDTPVNNCDSDALVRVLRFHRSVPAASHYYDRESDCVFVAEALKSQLNEHGVDDSDLDRCLALYDSGKATGWLPLEEAVRRYELVPHPFQLTTIVSEQCLYAAIALPEVGVRLGKLYEIPPRFTSSINVIGDLEEDLIRLMRGDNPAPEASIQMWGLGFERYYSKGHVLKKPETSPIVGFSDPMDDDPVSDFTPAIDIHHCIASGINTYQIASLSRQTAALFEVLEQVCERFKDQITPDLLASMGAKEHHLVRGVESIETIDVNRYERLCFWDTNPQWGGAETTRQPAFESGAFFRPWMKAPFTRLMTLEQLNRMRWLSHFQVAAEQPGEPSYSQFLAQLLGSYFTRDATNPFNLAIGCYAAYLKLSGVPFRPKGVELLSALTNACTKIYLSSWHINLAATTCQQLDEGTHVGAPTPELERRRKWECHPEWVRAHRAIQRRRSGGSR